ncbi:MAG: hypothetical protein DMD82_17085 [Candidatus Rokuibacteriota bacterium]|nr:MAG: hypothetical protein DMD82_17085 [Candidatus Rokubacteria bacterium]
MAVVADGFWPAKLGRDALTIEWDEGPTAAVSSGGITKTFDALTQQPGPVARHEGDAAAALTSAAKRLDAVYEVPYLAHATMEPMTCTAHVRPDGCDIWTGTQWQDGTQGVAAKITGLPAASIRVHTTLLGGGFGRRFEQDFVAEAVAIAKAVGAPVKLVWSREDDMQHDFYRPSTFNRLSAGIDAQGSLVAWTHRIISPSIAARAFPALIKDGIDGTSIEGAANIPYTIPNIHVECTMKETGVPVGFWRSVGSSQNAFITECFLDEIAAAAGKDPYELRRYWSWPRSRRAGDGRSRRAAIAASPSPSRSEAGLPRLPKSRSAPPARFASIESSARWTVGSSSIPIPSKPRWRAVSSTA